ncbi:MAG: ATP-binding protein [Deltaproteobacteria bacterium]|nr:ATP-binding protein [Deltaproteobacteria bacterium]MBI2228453.1 ATP-binding protein [Deltaproteobacteria bacterium]MBI2365402.1 ATP-binding protein [Deltaproteobacteria bacterium]MBI3066143.1 ATP-binding protein [Deltaproteobacteria bacterium]
MIKRSLGPVLANAKRSFLLLGPRQTGKSTLVSSLKPDLTINLAHEATYLEFARNPRELEERLGALPLAQRQTVFVDEVQRLPSLLNTVQALLDASPSRYRFFLTGSSARKLRRGRANLLPGRIFTYQLGPIVSCEMDYKLDTTQALSHGTLPGILVETDRYVKEKTLSSYAATYLKEEVQAEALTRNLEGFARFLSVCAEYAGRFLDLAKLAADAQIARQSAVRYFEVLEDCLIVQRLAPFAKSARRRLVQHPRYYFFDPGVLNGLLGNFKVSPDRIGNLFKHLIFTQIAHSALALDKQINLSSYRTEHGAEVDFIVTSNGETLAIESKASRNVGRSDLRGLDSFAEYYGKPHRSMVFYLGAERRKMGRVEVLPWQDGLREIGL